MVDSLGGAKSRVKRQSIRKIILAFMSDQCLA